MNRTSQQFLFVLLPLCLLGAATVANSAVVAHYGFNEGSGGTLYDSSGWGNNGAINGATWATGISGSALYFDGVNDYVEAPNSPSLAINSYAFSIEAWVSPASLVASGTAATIVSTFFGDGYYLRLQSDQIGFHSAGTLNGAYADVPLNTWSHVAGTFDGTIASVYLNGQLVASSQTVGPGPAQVSSPYPLRIGAQPISGNLPFHGSIDEVTIYDSLLSAQDVQQHYQLFAPAAVVPIPPAMLLLGSALLGLLTLQRSSGC